MERLPLIYNPAAGRKGLKSAEKAVNVLDRLGVEPIPLQTAGPGSAKTLAAAVLSEGFSRLVVAGGDGTVNEVVNGIAGSGIELAVIPTGTANVLALELGVPQNITKACRIAVSGECISVDLGKAGEQYFMLMAGIGFDALVIKNINPALKKTIRRAAFPVAGLKTFLAKELPLLTVSAGDIEVEGYFAIAANSRYYGGRFGPTPAASMTDGLLDICVLKEKNFQTMIDFWFKALSSGTADSARVEYFRAAEVDISAAGGEEVLLQLDGELAGELPVHISVAPLAQKVCIGAGR